MNKQELLKQIKEDLLLLKDYKEKFMNKQEILKHISKTENIKMNLKRILTDKNSNFDWNAFFNLYDENFSDKPYLNLEYNENKQNYKISDDFDFINIEHIKLINDDEMEITYNIKKKEIEKTKSQSSSNNLTPDYSQNSMKMIGTFFLKELALGITATEAFLNFADNINNSKPEEAVVSAFNSFKNHINTTKNMSGTSSVASAIDSLNNSINTINKNNSNNVNNTNTTNNKQKDSDIVSKKVIAKGNFVFFNLNILYEMFVKINNKNLKSNERMDNLPAEKNKKRVIHNELI